MYVIIVQGFVINFETLAGTAKNVETSSKLRSGKRNNPETALRILMTRKKAILTINNRCNVSDTLMCDRRLSLNDVIFFYQPLLK